LAQKGYRMRAPELAIVSRRRLKKVLNYLSDEEKHYEESGCTKNHIWVTIRQLKKEISL